MTRGLALMLAIAGLAGVAGVVTLARPAIARRLLGFSDSDPALYALRIAGMMLAALALFLGGFATAFHFAQ